MIIAESCPTLCDPMDCSTPGSYVLHCLPEFAQTHVHRVGDAIQPSPSLPPLFLLTSIFPSIGVFSNESALCISWPKYWSFSFSISASNEYSRLISFRIDWFDLQCNCQFKTHWHTYGCFLLGSSKEAHQAGLVCCHVKKHLFSIHGIIYLSQLCIFHKLNMSILQYQCRLLTRYKPLALNYRLHSRLTSIY